MGDIGDESIQEIIDSSRTVEDFMQRLSAPTGPSREGRPIELPSMTARLDRHFIPPLPVRLWAALTPLSGKALAVYLILWRRSRIVRSGIVTIPAAMRAHSGLTPRQIARALACLERHGFVTVMPRRGKSPLVTLCTVVPLPPRPEPPA